MLQFLSPILGGLIASKSAKKQQQQQQQYAQQALQEQRVYDRGTLQRIRDDALESGFNPLSVLRNGGTSIGSNTYLQAPALSSNDFFAQALMQAIDTGFNAPQRELDRETQRLQNDLLKAQIGDLQANTRHLSSYGFGIPAVETLGVSQTSMSSPPLARPTADTQQRIPVYLPDGQVRQVPASWASRMGIEAWGQLGNGDYEELVGSGRSEVEGALLVDRIGLNMGVPIFGATVTRPKLSYEIDGSFVP